MGRDETEAVMRAAMLEEPPAPSPRGWHTKAPSLCT